MPGLDHKHNLQITKLDLSYSETFNQTHLADAYERLLLETMRGIQALFVRRDEVEEAWKWVDSITEAWAADRDAPKPYQGRDLGTGCVGGQRSLATVVHGTSSSKAGG